MVDFRDAAGQRRRQALSTDKSVAERMRIELIRARHPHLVVMDINLPGMSGIEAMRRLAERADTREIPVIALSAAALPRDAIRANDAGFRRYLTKPVNIDELTTAFEEILVAATHGGS